MWRGNTRGVDMDAPARTAAPAGVPATWMTATGMSASSRFSRQRHAGAHAQHQTNDTKKVVAIFAGQMSFVIFCIEIPSIACRTPLPPLRSETSATVMEGPLTRNLPHFPVPLHELTVMEPSRPPNVRLLRVVAFASGQMRLSHGTQRYAHRSSFTRGGLDCGPHRVRPRTQRRSRPPGARRAERRPRCARPRGTRGSCRPARTPGFAGTAEPYRSGRALNVLDLGQLRDRLPRERSAGDGLLRPGTKSGDICRRTAGNLRR